jgi:hypothetical protein
MVRRLEPHAHRGGDYRSAEAGGRPNLNSRPQLFGSAEAISSRIARAAASGFVAAADDQIVRPGTNRFRWSCDSRLIVFFPFF